MGPLVFIKDYLVWHYSRAIGEGLVIWKNFIWFVSQFFSLGLLLRTLIQPWRRIKEYYSRGFDPKQYFEVLVINIIMRLVGFILRIFIIFIGLLSEVGVMVIGILMFIFWLGWPFLIILCLSRGLMIFF